MHFFINSHNCPSSYMVHNGSEYNSPVPIAYVGIKDIFFPTVLVLHMVEHY